MEKVSEAEEKPIEQESNSSVTETRSDKEDERIMIRGTISEEGSMDPSNSHTITFEDYDDDSDYEMEDGKVLELFRRKNSVRPEVTETNNFPDLDAVTLNSPILEGIKSSSSSNEDTEDDSSSNSDLDTSLSRYYFDGSLPFSSHVEESETHQDECSVPKDENKIPLLCPYQPVQQPTPWRNCCGLLQLLRSANP
ncbi:unnamed protein product [Microthlaspi erraticum]|uniref:Uncharacterized protein n=1 Tax=Microthlaspi erraticum TaxID=1685480 RepID=A0A6D2KRQ6_9BRAS|nr:unnamed protein product [Microthlaspi erraticum]